jgi:hypothetical protein
VCGAEPNTLKNRFIGGKGQANLLGFGVNGDPGLVAFKQVHSDINIIPFYSGNLIIKQIAGQDLSCPAIRSINFSVNPSRCH